jgi:flavin reductase (DIM6/NTAB) family NADH-FMN oxidoreductase RutF
MTDRKLIAFDDFNINPFHLFDKQWFLLTCGDFSKKHFNSMTISWGSLGIMWNKPFAQVVVRPTRYTFEFMNRYDSGTLCVFDDSYRSALSLLGSRSGRDGDKIRESGLTPIASANIAAPGYAEADLILECKKMYWQDYDNSHFIMPEIEEKYPSKDYHRVFFGEIVAIFGTDRFILKQQVNEQGKI